MAFVPADTAGPAKQIAFIPAGQSGKPVRFAASPSPGGRPMDITIEFSIALAELGAPDPANISEIRSPSASMIATSKALKLSPNASSITGMAISAPPRPMPAS